MRMYRYLLPVAACLAAPLQVSYGMPVIEKAPQARRQHFGPPFIARVTRAMSLPHLVGLGLVRVEGPRTQQRVSGHLGIVQGSSAYATKLNVEATPGDATKFTFIEQSPCKNFTRFVSLSLARKGEKGAFTIQAHEAHATGKDPDGAGSVALGPPDLEHLGRSLTYLANSP